MDYLNEESYLHLQKRKLTSLQFAGQRLDLVAFSGTIPSGPRLGENGFDKPRTAGRGAEAHSENQSRPVRLLSFDAGGVRGLAQLKTLERILDTPMLAKKAPAEVFDLIVGCERPSIILAKRVSIDVGLCQPDQGA